MCIRHVRVPLGHRAIVHLDERPDRWLGPGSHWVISHPLEHVRVLRLDTSALVTKLDAEQLALAPEGEIRVVRVAPHERALVTVRGRAARWLGAGEHHVWTVERSVDRSAAGARVLVPAVDVTVVDVSAIEAPAVPDEVRALIPASERVDAVVPQGAVALRYVDGVLDAELGPGRHAAWTVVRKVALATIELRERVLAVSGQEVMTKDRVTLRLNVSATYRVADARRLATVARDADEILYLAVQVAAREAVTTRTLDELLADREALAGAVKAEVVARAAAVGLELHELAVKDLVLPGEMRTLLNQVIEAQKRAEANVILRREETAATRSLAQTAKVLAENPLLVRLKELEAYAELASKVGKVQVVLGAGAIPRLSEGDD